MGWAALVTRRISVDVYRHRYRHLLTLLRLSKMRNATQWGLLNSFHFISFIVHETDRVYNPDVEDKNIISVVGSLAIAGQISLLSNVA